MYRIKKIINTTVEAKTRTIAELLIIQLTQLTPSILIRG